MNAIAILFAIGVILLAFEVIVPGAIMGIIGALALIGGCIIAQMDYGWKGGLTATGVALSLLGLTFYLEFIVIPKTKLGQRLFLKATISGSAQAIDTTNAEQLVGKTAKTLTPLTPSGYIILDGQRHEAFSRDGSIEKDISVRIVGADNFRIIVSSLSTKLNS